MYQPDPASCKNYCAQSSANACEWNVNGNCYVEFGTACYVAGGYPGWYAAVLTSSPPPPPPPSRTVLLVNGSFNAYPPWMDQGSPEYQAIASTYGVQPVTFRWTDNDFAGVVFPFYDGIWNGAAALAGVIDALPPGEIYVITHSHGGNVALLATTFYTNRPITRLINLATPVNWDIRGSYGPRTSHMCTASSWGDWVQFLGSSPYQVYNFSNAAYYAYVYGRESAEAWIDGRYDDATYYAILASQSVYAGYSWWESTKLEFWGWTLMFDGLNHGDMHEPPVWYAIPSACKQ